MKKIMVIGVIGMLTVMSMTGCGKKATPDALLTDMSNNLEKIESVVVQYKMEALDGNGSFKMDTEIRMTRNPERYHMNGNMIIPYMGGTNIESPIEVYGVKKDDGFVEYSRVDDTWYEDKQRTISKDIIEFAEGWEEVSEHFVLSEKLTEVGGKKCFELKGQIPVGDLEDFSEGELADDILGGEMDYTHGTINEEEFVPCTIEIYRDSILPARISAGVSGETKGLDDAYTDYKVSATYEEYNTFSEIKIPEDVKTAVPDSDIIADEKVEEQNTETAKTELGSEWGSYTVQIKDKVLTLPFSVSELESLGLVLDTDDTAADYVINAEKYHFAYFEDSFGNKIMVTLTNHTDSPQKIKNCAITGVDVDQSFLETDHLKVIFPGGIQIGSTKEEVIEAYGMCEEENIYEDEYEEQYTWYAPDTFWNNCDISFDIDTGTVSNMSLEKNE